MRPAPNGFSALPPGTESRFREIELKLAGTPRSLAAIFDKLGDGAAKIADVDSTYFDTADRRLWQRGYTLRLRRRGDVIELTLKRQDGGPLARGEWTATLSEPLVDLAELPPEAPRSQIGTILPEELRPVFATTFERTRKRLDLPGASVEAALDLGTIAAGKREAPIAELELELLDGGLAAMLRHLKTTLRNRNFVIGTRTKSDRGMDLADDVPPRTTKAIKPRLTPADTIDTALARMVAASTNQVLGNIAAAADGRNPEGVHQLRVALRRLRSGFTLFKGHVTRQVEALDQAARNGFKALGPARDYDVFLLETLPPVLESNPENPELSALAVAAQERRDAAHQAVRDLVEARWFNRFLLDLLLAGEAGGLVRRDRDKPLDALAATVLQKRHKKVLKLGRGFADLAYAERHEVRIALKKLRYACDDFRDLFPGKLTKAYLKRLSALQDDLGRLNDATVAGGIADGLAADAPDGETAAAMIKGWYGHRLRHVEPHMREDWLRFTEARPFWKS